MLNHEAVPNRAPVRSPRFRDEMVTSALPIGRARPPLYTGARMTRSTRRALRQLSALGVVAAIGASGCTCNRQRLPITGMASSFTQPLVTKMLQTYDDPFTHVQLATLGPEESARSKLLDHQVDYFATEGPVPLVGQPTLSSRPVVVPIAIGAVALVYDLPGVPSLSLSPDAVSAIYRGEAKTWDAPVIAAGNPGVALPSLPIDVVHRSDQSSTTAIFAGYLATISPAWGATHPVGLTVQWPVGRGVDGPDAVVEAVRATPGATSFLALAGAVDAKLSIASVGNASSRYVMPTIASMSAAADGVDWPPGTPPPSLLARPGEGAYPICSLVYVVFDTSRLAGAQVTGIAAFLRYAIGDGQKLAAPLQFSPLPGRIVEAYAAGLDELQQDRSPPPPSP